MVGMTRAQADMSHGINFSDPMLPRCVDFSSSMLPRPQRGTFPKEWINALEDLKLEPECNTAAVIKLQDAFKAMLDAADCRTEARLLLRLCRAEVDDAMDKVRLDASAKAAAQKHAAEVASRAKTAEKLAADRYAADVARSEAAANDLWGELDAEQTASQLAQKQRRRRKRAAQQKRSLHQPEPAGQPGGPSITGHLCFFSLSLISRLGVGVLCRYRA